jgi:hypothetical protein
MIIRSRDLTTNNINQSLRHTVEHNHRPLPRRRRLSFLHRVPEICDERINKRERKTLSGKYMIQSPWLRRTKRETHCACDMYRGRSSQRIEMPTSSRHRVSDLVGAHLGRL